MLLGLASGLVFGPFPAIQLVRIDPQAAFRTGSGTARSRLRNTIMGIQVALALLVLVVAALFFRSFRETRAADPGFSRDGILLAAYDLLGRNANPAFARTVASRLLEQLRALPSIESASIASSVPLDIHGMPMISFTVEGHARPSAALDRALTNSVTPGYFATMDIPLRAGTDFADLSDVSAPPQVIVNEEFTRRYLENLDPLGRHVQTRNRSYVITGVVRNSVYDSFGERATPILYFSYRDRPARQVKFMFELAWAVNFCLHPTCAALCGTSIPPSAFTTCAR
jgi:putative ABC transport system permease protein